jgi:hypothetical protein
MHREIRNAHNIFVCKPQGKRTWRAQEWMDSSGSGEVPIVEFCEHSDEPFRIHTSIEFLDQLSNSQVFKEECTMDLLNSESVERSSKLI